METFFYSLWKHLKFNAYIVVVIFIMEKEVILFSLWNIEISLFSLWKHFYFHHGNIFLAYIFIMEKEVIIFSVRLHGDRRYFL